ncbi:ArsC family transcriptional regulator [Haloplanus salilacus]|uniref:arsenate-mycothiol transferase ArsC n=1 Tax=Haloplanus salilacus TaxID=2949994 RepID=UPI0030D0206E
MSETNTEPIRIAFVCVRNAGRSQMAAAFAARERDRRRLDGEVEILSGGTHPADAVHAVVVDAMAEVGIDVSDRTPREITDAELGACDHVATMGCSTLDLGEVDVRDWALDDPGEEDIERVREIRDEVERRVVALFDELDAERA